MLCVCMCYKFSVQHFTLKNMEDILCHVEPETHKNTDKYQHLLAQVLVGFSLVWAEFYDHSGAVPLSAGSLLKLLTMSTFAKHKSTISLSLREEHLMSNNTGHRS